jgi:hypothetical protein
MIIDGTIPIKPYVENNRLFCDVEFFPTFGLPPIKLEHNTLSGRPRNWDWNHNDKALEIVNEDLVPIFQMYYKDDTHVMLNGVFPLKGELWICTEAGTETIRDSIIKTRFPDGIIPVNLNRLFKYPSFKYPGQFEEEQSTNTSHVVKLSF